MANKTTSYRETLLNALIDPVEAAHYLNAAIEDSDESFLKALKNVAQARQMAKVAKGAGVQRETLYRSLSEQGNPTLNTLSSILGVLGLRMAIAAVDEDPGFTVMSPPTSMVHDAVIKTGNDRNPLDGAGQNMSGMEDAVWMAKSNQFALGGESAYASVRHS